MLGPGFRKLMYFFVLLIDPFNIRVPLLSCSGTFIVSIYFNSCKVRLTLPDSPASHVIDGFRGSYEWIVMDML